MSRDTHTPYPLAGVLEIGGNRVKAAYSALNIDSPDSRVWTAAVPQNFDPGYPRTILEATLRPDLGRSTLEKEAVAVDLEARASARDMQRLLEVEEESQNRLTDIDSKVEPAGFQCTRVALLPTIPEHAFPPDEANTFQRILRVRYHLKTTS